MRRISLLLLALAGTGCFSMTQEIWINPDGTGRILFDVGFSDELLSMAKGSGEDPAASLRTDMEKTKKEMAADPTVSSVETSERSEGGMRHFVMDVHLRQMSGMKSMKGLGGPHGETARTNDIRVEELPNGNLLFAGRYEVPQNTQLDELTREGDDPSRDAMTRGMMGAFFADKYFTVRLHAPRIVSANGTLDAERRTVEWKTPVVQVIAPGAALPDMRAEIDLGRRRWVWVAAAVAGVLLLLGGAAFVILRARRA